MSLAHRIPGLPGRECAVGIRLATFGLLVEVAYGEWPVTRKRFSTLCFRFWPGAAGWWSTTGDSTLSTGPGPVAVYRDRQLASIEIVLTNLKSCTIVGARVSVCPLNLPRIHSIAMKSGEGYRKCGTATAARLISGAGNAHGPKLLTASFRSVRHAGQAQAVIQRLVAGQVRCRLNPLLYLSDRLHAGQRCPEIGYRGLGAR
jgi:hypothetical protein